MSFNDPDSISNRLRELSKESQIARVVDIPTVDPSRLKRLRDLPKHGLLPLSLSSLVEEIKLATASFLRPTDEHEVTIHFDHIEQIY